MTVGAAPEVAPDVFEQIESHVHSETTREVGGILVGRVERGVIVIDAALPALRAVGASANVTFTHEVWEEVLPKVDRDYPDSQIIGWYHSHPGFGVFLSEYDLFIHRNFFADESMLALVIDPLSGEGGWFGWRDGDVEQLASIKGRASKAQAAVAVERAIQGRNRRGAAVLVAALLAVVGFGGGYALASRDATTSPAASADSTESALREAQAEISQLRGQLAAGAGPSTTAPSAPAGPPSSGPPSSGPPSSGPVDVLVSYEVRRGDCLWCLAKRFYGDGNLLGRILDANPGLGPQLVEGQTVKIPLRLESAAGQLQLPEAQNG